MRPFCTPQKRRLELLARFRAGLAGVKGRVGPVLWPWPLVHSSRERIIDERVLERGRAANKDPPHCSGHLSESSPSLAKGRRAFSCFGLVASLPSRHPFRNQMSATVTMSVGLSHEDSLGRPLGKLRDGSLSGHCGGPHTTTRTNATKRSPCRPCRDRHGRPSCPHATRHNRADQGLDRLCLPIQVLPIPSEGFRRALEAVKGRVGPVGLGGKHREGRECAGRASLAISSADSGELLSCEVKAVSTVRESQHSVTDAGTTAPVRPFCPIGTRH